MNTLKATLLSVLCMTSCMLSDQVTPRPSIHPEWDLSGSINTEDPTIPYDRPVRIHQANAVTDMYSEGEHIHNSLGVLIHDIQIENRRNRPQDENTRPVRTYIAVDHRITNTNGSVNFFECRKSAVSSPSANIYTYPFGPFSWHIENDVWVLCEGSVLSYYFPDALEVNIENERNGTVLIWKPEKNAFNSYEVEIVRAVDFENNPTNQFYFKVF